MSEYVIRCLGLVGTATNAEVEPFGMYLQAYDPDAAQGRGWAEWTEHIEKAMVFPSQFAALATWRATSGVRPVRPDGEPNRPLTAFSVEVIPLKGESDG